MTSYQRLNQDQYADIFEHAPSFNEKKAFVNVFRKKWKEDKGYCSLFDKLRNCRLAKSHSLDKVERRTKLNKAMKLRVTKIVEQAKQAAQQVEQEEQ